MSQEKPKQNRRSATEYRLSITSNSESRRSSLGGTIENGTASSGKVNRTGGVTGSIDDGDAIVQEFILPQIREFSDSMITLDANFTQLNFIHESLVDFNESLGSLLYGLMCNSWCVDFPHISHDIEEELQTAKRLDALKAEKESLVAELSAYREKANPSGSQHTSSLRSPFVPPLPPSKIHRQKLFKTNSNIHEDEDENASEASFISNPTLNVPRHEISKPRPSNTNKLRRKSILHTIRNSISANDLAEDGRTSEHNTQRNRLSLGGGATRIVTTSPPFERNTGQSRMAQPKTTRPQEKRRKPPLDGRPPFR